MFARVRTSTLIAAAAAVGLSAAGAFAGSLQLGDSGWTAEWPDSANVSLDVLTQNDTTVFLKKTAAFSTLDNLPITFMQTSTSALPQIAISSEDVTNNTGQAWNGFRWIILGSSTGTLADAQFNVDDSKVGDSNGFIISPFTSSAFTDNSGTGSDVQPKVLTVNDGGTIADGGVYQPGATAEGAGLFIHAAPNATGDYAFTLKEVPLAGTTPPPPIIPLPAAFWSGLSGLLGLAGLGLIRRRKLA